MFRFSPLEYMQFIICHLALLVSKLASTVSDLLNSAHEDNNDGGGQSSDDDGPLLLQTISTNGMSHSTVVKRWAAAQYYFEM